VEARTVSGQHHSRNVMKAIRTGLERYQTQASHRKTFFIIHDKVFVPSNEALDSHLKSLAKTGVLSSTKYKQAVEREDVETEKLFTTKKFGKDTPGSPVQTAWFYLLWQARTRKSEKYGKGRYCFRKNCDRLGICCLSKANE